MSRTMPSKRTRGKRVRETFKAKIYKNIVDGYVWLDMVQPKLKSKQWSDGDEVSVTVKRLRRKRQKGK